MSRQMAIEFDPEEGERLRLEGQKRALENAGVKWRHAIRFVVLANLRDYHQITSDDVRQWAIEWGIPDPPHPNAWGGLFTSLAAKGLIRDTGDRVRTKLRDGHRRKITVWRVL